MSALGMDALEALCGELNGWGVGGTLPEWVEYNKFELPCMSSDALRRACLILATSDAKHSKEARNELVASSECVNDPSFEPDNGSTVFLEISFKVAATELAEVSNSKLADCRERVDSVP